MTELRTELSVVSEGGRVSVIDNTLWPAKRAALRHRAGDVSRERAVEVPGFVEATNDAADPARFLYVPAGCAWPALVHGSHGGARG